MGAWIVRCQRRTVAHPPSRPRMTDPQRSPRPAISCVMPAYDEAENLPVVLPDVTAQLAELTDRWELIVVDDGSRDATPQAMLPWLRQAGVRYVRLSRNFGKEAAVTAIIDYLPAERLAGQSSFSMRSLMRLAFTGVTAFTNLPLRLWSALGAVIAFGAIGFGVWIIIEHFIRGHDVPGWATLVTGMMLFS